MISIALLRANIKLPPKHVHEIANLQCYIPAGKLFSGETNSDVFLIETIIQYRNLAGQLN